MAMFSTAKSGQITAKTVKPKPNYYQVTTATKTLYFMDAWATNAGTR